MKKLFMYILTVVLGIGAFCLNPIAVYADDVQYSNVLEDLSKDETFDPAAYPAVADDYALHVIQIAESSSGELFIYVYQPAAETKPLTATSINISTAINDSLFYRNYTLRLLNCSGTLGKYLVEDFTVKTDALRYYDISSVYRAWDGSIDDGLPDYNENAISEKAFAVAKLYTASTVNGVVSYSCLATETILITDKYVGYLRYDNGFFLSISKCDSWYVAFSTDRRIDKLMEADVYFVSRLYRKTVAIGIDDIVIWDDPTDNYVSLQYTDVASNPADGLFGKKYTWNRIQSVPDFVKTEKLTGEGLEDLQNKQWVLRFAETNYNLMIGGNGSTTETSTKVSDVTILRLKFETAGKVYNLGVVDNKQTPPPDALPDNTNTGCQDMEWLFWLVILILLCLVCAPILPYVFQFLFWLIRAVVKVITAPFKAIARAVSSAKRNTQSKKYRGKA